MTLAAEKTGASKRLAPEVGDVAELMSQKLELKPVMDGKLLELVNKALQAYPPEVHDELRQDVQEALDDLSVPEVTIQDVRKAAVVPMEVQPQQAYAYIHNPLAEFGGRRRQGGPNMAKLFSTHPSTDDRIAALTDLDRRRATPIV